MPRLINPTGHHLFAPQIHRQLDAFEQVDITDAEAALFEGNSVFVVESPAATRRQVTRGAHKAEVDGPPVMEKR